MMIDHVIGGKEMNISRKTGREQPLNRFEQNKIDGNAKGARLEHEQQRSQGWKTIANNELLVRDNHSSRARLRV